MVALNQQRLEDRNFSCIGLGFFWVWFGFFFFFRGREFVLLFWSGFFWLAGLLRVLGGFLVWVFFA